MGECAFSCFLIFSTFHNTTRSKIVLCDISPQLLCPSTLDCTVFVRQVKYSQVFGQTRSFTGGGSKQIL